MKASETTPLSEHQGPYWGQFGGRYVPEALITALDELERVYNEAKADPEFHKEFMTLQQRYVGRPEPADRSPALLRTCQREDRSRRPYLPQA